MDYSARCLPLQQDPLMRQEISQVRVNVRAEAKKKRLSKLLHEIAGQRPGSVAE